MKLFRKNSNLCDHNSPTLQTDRQTTCDGNTALCTKVHRAVISSVPFVALCSLFVPTIITFRLSLISYKQKCKVVSLNLAHPVYTRIKSGTHKVILDISSITVSILCCAYNSRDAAHHALHPRTPVNITSQCREHQRSM